MHEYASRWGYGQYVGQIAEKINEVAGETIATVVEVPSKLGQEEKSVLTISVVPVGSLTEIQSEICGTLRKNFTRDDTRPTLFGGHMKEIKFSPKKSFAD